MKIFDCFMYFDEEVVLDLRLNTLNEYVDHFVIVESKFTHRGDKRHLKFNHEKFKKFKDKIIYLVYDEEPPKVREIKSEYSVADKSGLYILNAAYRENAQRNYIKKGLDEAHDNDLILISDVDEIPNLSKIDIKKINQKIILFKQDMFYYKFNLAIPNFKWTGTKACKKKDLVNPQWIRNVKDRKYKFFRLDTYFSNTKYTSIKIIEDGGWHFSFVMSHNSIKKKLESYAHSEFNKRNYKDIKNIKKNISLKKDLFGRPFKFIKIKNHKKLPKYLLLNKKKFSKLLI